MMMTYIIDKRTKLSGQVVNINASSRLRLQKRINEININIDCLTGDCWQVAAEIVLDNNRDKVRVIDNGCVTAGDIVIKPTENPGWWQISSAKSKVKIKTNGRVELSPAFPAAYTFNDDYKTGVYAPNSEIDYEDGAFSTRMGNTDLYFIVIPVKDDIRRELLHQSSTDLATPKNDVLSCCDLGSAMHATPLNDLAGNPVSQADAICWHQSLKTGEFYPPWDKYAPYMPAVLLKTFKFSGLCEYGNRALMALAYLNDIGETAKGLTKNDSAILRSLQALLICENI